MHGIETQLEQATEESVEHRPEVSPQESERPTRERQARPFSPDPMQRTDRYRLVTPYQLSRDD